MERGIIRKWSRMPLCPLLGKEKLDKCEKYG